MAKVTQRDFKTFLKEVDRMRAVVAIAITLLAPVIKYLSSGVSYHPTNVKLDITLGQLVFLVVIVVCFPFIHDNVCDVRRFPEESVLTSMFLKLWESLWYTMMVFYLIFVITTYLKLDTPTASYGAPWASAFLKYAETLANTAVGTFAFACFWLLAKPKSSKYLKTIYLFLVVAAVVDLLWELRLLQQINTGLAATGSIYKNQLQLHQHALAIASGVWNALSFTALIGRIDGRLLRVPISVILCLYLYAIIQIGYGQIFIGGEADLFLLVGSFIGKVILFFLVYWLISDRWIFWYFSSASKIDLESRRIAWLNKVDGHSAFEEEDLVHHRAIAARIVYGTDDLIITARDILKGHPKFYEDLKISLDTNDDGRRLKKRTLGALNYVRQDNTLYDPEVHNRIIPLEVETYQKNVLYWNRFILESVLFWDLRIAQHRAEGYARIEPKLGPTISSKQIRWYAKWALELGKKFQSVFRSKRSTANTATSNDND